MNGDPMNEENIRTSRCRDSIESDAIDCPTSSPIF